jgi:hypothetical protein
MSKTEYIVGYKGEPSELNGQLGRFMMTNWTYGKMPRGTPKKINLPSNHILKFSSNLFLLGKTAKITSTRNHQPC